MNRSRSAFAIVIGLATGAALYGGQMMVQFGETNTPEARVQQAVLTFRSVGCHQPESVSYSATAEGIVNGKRSSMPLAILPLDGNGLAGVKREWPSEGKWVVLINATQGEMHWGTVVNPDDRQSAAHFLRPVTSSDAAAVLASPLPMTAGVEH